MFWEVHRIVIGSRYIHVHPPSPWSLKPEKTVKTDRDRGTTVLPPEGAGNQTKVASDVSDREGNHAGPPFQETPLLGAWEKGKAQNTLVLFFIDMYNKKKLQTFSYIYKNVFHGKSSDLLCIYNTQQLCIVNKKTLSITWHECQ